MNDITLLNVGLQGLVLVAVGWITLRLGVKDARHRAWTALLALVTATILPFALLAFPQPTAPPQATSVSLPEPNNWKIHLDSPPTQTTPAIMAAPTSPSGLAELPWGRLLACVWLTGSLIFAFHGTLRLWQTHRWRQTLRHLTDEESSALPALTSTHNLRVSPTNHGPCLIGCFHPLIVVPSEAFQSWTSERWRWMLAHENEHRRSGDTWIMGCLGLVKLWLWWNPFMHGLIAHWEQAREEICDAAALAGQSNHPTAYTTFLLELLATQRHSHFPILSMATSRPAKRMKRRLQAVLEQRPVAPRLHRLFIAAAILLTSLAGLTVRTLGVEPTPQTSVATKDELETRVITLPPHFDGAKNAQAWLTQLDVIFPEGSSAVFNRTTSQLIVRQTRAGHEQISHLITKWKAGIDYNQKQIYLSTKWLEVPDNLSQQDPQLPPLTSVGPILTDPQLQVVFRALSQKKGVDLLTAPSVTTRVGQRATVEVLREVVVSPQGRTDFAGVRCDLTANIKNGHQIEVMISADMGVAFQDGKRLKDWKTMTSSLMKILHLYATKTALLNDGETLVIPSGDSEPGRKVMLFVTAAFIQPTGQKVTPDQLRQLATTAANAPPHQPETAPLQKPVRIRAKILEEKGTVALKAFLPAQNPDVTPDQLGALDASIATSPLPPGTLSLSGIMSSDQFTALIKTLQQDTRVQMTDAPVERVITGAATLTRITADQVLQVTSTIGADGQTIDLNLHLLIEDKKPGITTSVSIWPGQTVILSGIMSVDQAGNPTLSRAITLTAEIEPSNENK